MQYFKSTSFLDEKNNGNKANECLMALACVKVSISYARGRGIPDTSFLYITFDHLEAMG